ncbi:MAG: WYL domain-containing protein, partial [Treponema sp.]|nr:WYL domain-containing protein [Treponema sp.]
VFAGKKYRFKIALNKIGAQWAGERKWAADQKIKETDTGFIIEFTSTQYNRVLEWVLSRGKDAYPLEPAVLASEWKKHVRGMMKKFEGS